MGLGSNPHNHLSPCISYVYNTYMLNIVVRGDSEPIPKHDFINDNNKPNPVLTLCAYYISWVQNVTKPCRTSIHLLLFVMESIETSRKYNINFLPSLMIQNLIFNHCLHKCLTLSYWPTSKLVQMNHIGIDAKVFTRDRLNWMRKYT